MSADSKGESEQTRKDEKAEGETDEERGFSPDDLETCLKVMRQMTNERVREKRYRSFRLQLRDLTEFVTQDYWGGESMSKHKKKMRLKKTKEALLRRLKAADEKKVRRAELRQHRIAKLQKLIQPRDQPKQIEAPHSEDKSTTPQSLSSKLNASASHISKPSSSSSSTATTAPPSAHTAPSAPTTSSAPTVSSAPTASPSPPQPDGGNFGPIPMEIEPTGDLSVHESVTPRSDSVTPRSDTHSDKSPYGSDVEDVLIMADKKEQKRKKSQKQRPKKSKRKRKVKEKKAQALTDQELKEVLGSDDEVLSDLNVLNYPKTCYVCKAPFNVLHHFYDSLCPKCASVNWEKRNQTADLKGKVAVLTGSRVKIGFECGVKLLRCGATLIATTRFPHDCARRYSLESDFEEWKHRLHIFGLDMRDLKSVVNFCSIISEKYDYLDIIVNNAAQTVRRPPAFYRHLIKDEMGQRHDQAKELLNLVKNDPHVGEGNPDYMKISQQSLAISDGQVTSSSNSSLKIEEIKPQASTPQAPTTPAAAATATEEEEKVQMSDTSDSQPMDILPDDPIMNSVLGAIAGTDNSVSTSAVLSQMPVLKSDTIINQKEFPEGRYDVEGQQVDLRRINSWTLLLHQVEPGELVETFAINALAPFIINSRLKHMLQKSSRKGLDKWVINVSAMEGKFYRHKLPTHPHTNMAKAALNMMTRTSAIDFKKSRIFMNSVDTGWINDEKPFHRAQRAAKKHGFQTPIDEKDAAARILDLIMIGANSNRHPCGRFFKDFKVTEW